MIYRSEPYKAFIRSRPCLMRDGNCSGDIVAHHEPMGQGGMRIKAPDSQCLPLCAFHHSIRHNKGKGVFKSYDIPMLIIKYLTMYLEKNKL